MLETGNSPEDGKVHLPVHDSRELGAAEFSQLELLVAVILLEAVELQLVELHLGLHDVLLRSLYRGLNRVSALKI